jgi:uroporphyrin-III C-methyltransferase
MTAANHGRVFLVGAGPGAPDLLTLRALRLLQQADIVLHDALVHPETLALASKARLVQVGKRCGRHATAQSFINKRLVDAARRYACVVRLKGGDPMLFGRAQEELDALAAAGITAEVVPGITAAVAASAALGVSLTRRGLSRHVCMVTPRVAQDPSAVSDNDWVSPLLLNDTAVIYMGASQAAAIASTLIARGKPATTPLAVVQNASLPTQRQVFGQLQELPRLVDQLQAHAGLEFSLERVTESGLRFESASSGPILIVLGEVLRECLARSQGPAAVAA